MQPRERNKIYYKPLDSGEIFRSLSANSRTLAVMLLGQLSLFLMYNFTNLLEAPMILALYAFGTDQALNEFCETRSSKPLAPKNFWALMCLMSTFCYLVCHFFLNTLDRDGSINHTIVLSPDKKRITQAKRFDEYTQQLASGEWNALSLSDAIFYAMSRNTVRCLIYSLASLLTVLTWSHYEENLNICDILQTKNIPTDFFADNSTVFISLLIVYLSIELLFLRNKQSIVEMVNVNHSQNLEFVKADHKKSEDSQAYRSFFRCNIFDRNVVKLIQGFVYGDDGNRSEKTYRFANS